MASNISGFGLSIRLVASVTFPAGITLTQFSDDTDPFDIPSIQIADKAMGINGDLITWSKANPIITTMGFIPDSQDDINLSIILEANRVAKNKTSAFDSITLTGIYPDGSSVTLANGTITDGMPANAVASAGRLKSKTYSFVFENKTSTQI